MAHMKRRDSNRARREQRQAEAAIRQEIYDGLSFDQRLEKLGNLTATKQRAKIARQSENKVVAALAETVVAEKKNKKKGKKNA